MHTKLLATAAAVANVAHTIGQCDFRTVMSAYTTSGRASWVITVGESSWHRHLVVLDVNEDGTYAQLGLLNIEQSSRRIIDIDTSAIELTMTLKELIADSYIGVKNLLNNPILVFEIVR